MRKIAIELWSSAKDLFPTYRDLRMVLGLVALATIVSISELLLARLFSSLILPSEPRETSEIIVLSAVFLGVFALLRLVNFGREYYRLNVFEKALTDDDTNRFSNSWRWATAMELTSLLTMIGRFVFIFECRFDRFLIFCESRNFGNFGTGKNGHQDTQKTILSSRDKNKLAD